MSPYILQLRRRIFWAAYTLDRMMAMSLGRPAGISDHDIDIELPLVRSLSCLSSGFRTDRRPLQDYGVTDRAMDPANAPSGPTSMSSSIQFIKLCVSSLPSSRLSKDPTDVDLCSMRIESLIQKQAYRVDRPSSERPEPLLQLIDEWVVNIPSVAADESCWQLPCCSRDCTCLLLCFSGIPSSLTTFTSNRVLIEGGGCKDVSPSTMDDRP